MDTPYSFDSVISGSDTVATTSVTIASGQTLPVSTPLGMVAATGKFKAFDPTASDGTQNAVYMTAFAVDSSGGDAAAQVYKAGTFDPEQLNWPAGATSLHKMKAFVGTPISLQTLGQS